jgi:diguanylate cyclase (GGDEF)-like protein
MPAPLSILIVEDDPLMAAVLKARMQKIFPGVAVDMATDSASATDLIAQRAHAVCFVDLFLGETATGLDLIEDLGLRYPATAFIIMTAHSRRELAADAMRFGACDYLIKGAFDDFELEKSVNYALYRKEREIEIHRLATRDTLTGLANRAAFLDRLGNALARGRRRGDTTALLYIDIDGFKPVNDTHGHAAGDAVLVGIADRIRHHIRAADTAARLGGDEFAVLLEAVVGTASAVTVAKGIVDALKEPFTFEGKLIRIGGSIGVACTSEDGDDPDGLIAAADQRMYRAKRSGGGVVAR